MDKNGYPTETELDVIKKWDFRKETVEDLIEYIRVRWMYSDSGGFRLRGKKIVHLQLHTGGWSGNEDLIEALEQNFVFWPICWQKSTRGGHYYFRIPLALLKPDHTNSAEGGK